jgi:hypothetical protein
MCQRPQLGRSAHLAPITAWQVSQGSSTHITARTSPLPCSRLLVDAKRAKREKKAQLVAVMRQLPDFSMEVSWVGDWHTEARSRGMFSACRRQEAGWQDCRCLLASLVG